MGRAWVDSAAYRAMIEVIAEKRAGSGISQRELARRLGKPPSYVNKIELCERRLDIVEFVAIAGALAVPAEQLFASVLEALRKA